MSGDEGLGTSLVRGGNQANAIVLTGVGLGNVKSAICRAIIPDEEFKIGVGLRQDAGDGGGKVGRSVISREQEGYEWRHKITDAKKSNCCV